MKSSENHERGATPARGTRGTYLLISYVLLASTLIVIAGAFAWTAGWLTLESPRRLTSERIIDGFEGMTGRHPGFRRNHAKGICVSGYFESNGQAAWLSKASVFKAGTFPLIGRLSMPGSDPRRDDASIAVRSLALLITLPDREQWRTAMNSVPIFAVRTPEALYEQLKAQAADAHTGRPDPAAMEAFLEKHPETRAFNAWLDAHPAASGFDNAAYYSINTFRFIDNHGAVRYVRWSVVPEGQYRAMSEAQARDPDFLAHDLVTRLARGPIRWHLMIAVAQPGDPTADATRTWPADRNVADAGTVVIKQAQSQIDGPCRDVNFDPLILPEGIEASADPLLAARSAAYAVSFNRRTREEARVPIPGK
jgi:catalase